jgi:hypothetical protein
MKVISIQTPSELIGPLDVCPGADLSKLNVAKA